MSQYISTIAIDLAKSIFHLVLFQTNGKKLGRKRLNAQKLRAFL